jgi:hypothetical protein
MKARRLPTYIVNRNPNNRKRHVDPDCRALELAREWLLEMQDSHIERYEDNEITEETRFVAVTPNDAEELAALEAFTTPCRMCVPGAEELWQRCPVTFEPRY